MGATFVVTLREGVEIGLVLTIIFAYLRKVGRLDRSGPVWLGAGLAAALSAGLGAVIFVTLGQFTGRAEQLFEGTTLLIATALITSMLFWMKRQSARISSAIRSRVDDALAGSSTVALTLLAFTGVLREGIETSVFLIASARASNPLEAFSGAVLGLVVAAALSYGIYRGAVRMNLRVFFGVTGVFLVLFAAGLLERAVGEFHEAGVLGALSTPAYNLGAWLTDEQGIGSFLKALVGYTSKPTVLQILVYATYVVIVYTLLRRVSPAGREASR